MSTVVKDLGAVSAYAYAVEKGYTGTEAEFAELMADYAEVGQRAEDAADSALESKTAAQTAATTATNKASEATTAATTATTKAGEASTSASTATSAKDTAVSASQTATSKATEATTAAATATSAKTDAVAANTAAQSAKTAAQTAQTGAETAAASVSASAEQIATNAADISQLKSDLSSMYDSTLALIPVNATLISEIDDAYVNSTGGITTGGGTWRILSMPVKSGEKYKIESQVYGIYCVTFYDVNDTFVSHDGVFTGNTLHSIDITVPNTAVKMSINDRHSKHFNVRQYVAHFENQQIVVNNRFIESLFDALGGAEAIGIQNTENLWNVVCDKFVYTIQTNGSSNGAFSYYDLLHNNNLFNYLTDDITPLSIADVGFVGANHGFAFCYKATKESHGLTIADIGKACEIDGNTWVLLQIDSTSKFTVVCLDNSVWFGAKTVTTAPTTFNFGSEITVTSIAKDQIRPSLKNIDVSIVENTADRFVVSEQYDIIDLKTGLTGIINNVGNNTNISYAEFSDSVITTRNVYMFFKNGAITLIQNVKMLNNAVTLTSYGGTQSGKFETTDYFCIPMTTYDVFQAYGGNQYNFYREYWDDQTKPPIIYCQMDNAGASANRMMVQGILVNNRNTLIQNNAGNIYSTGKMYPYAIAPLTSSPVGTTYNIITFRIPIYANDYDTDVKFCGYTLIGNDCYFFIYNNTSVEKTIKVASKLIGKTVETVISKNASCLNSIVSTGIDVKITGEGYLLLKLS